MSWLLHTFAKIRALWRLVEAWERRFLLREKEWRFPIAGTAEDFRERFGAIVPAVSRNEYFRRYDKWDKPGSFGFCDSYEIVLKVPNPPPIHRIGKGLHTQNSLHHFHGSLNRDAGGWYVYGRYRLPQHIARSLLSGINVFLFYIVAALVVAALAYGVGALTGAAVPQLIAYVMVFQFPMFAPLYVMMGFTAWLNGRLVEHRDWHAREETYRLLRHICGGPAMQPTPQT